jgi:hypothetical protein
MANKKMKIKDRRREQTRERHTPVPLALQLDCDKRADLALRLRRVQRPAQHTAQPVAEVQRRDGVRWRG